MTDAKPESPVTPDPAEMQRQFEAFAQKSQEIYMAFLARNPSQDMAAAFDGTSIGQAFQDWQQNLMANPNAIADAQKAYWDATAKLWQATSDRMAGKPAEPVIEPDKGDRRFRDAAWTDEVVFDYMKQSYLLYAQYTHALVSGADGLDDKTRDKVDFYARRYVEALAPGNFASTNPTVLRKARETGGQNLIDGFDNLLRDLERGDGQLKITMSDQDAFELGRNLAYTPGSVIYQNDMMQLIQYAPATETVYKKPLLIVPPWINKYYVLDLTDQNSMVKWAVDQGYTVFLISWVNPDADLAHKGFENYMLEGPLAALDAIEAATGEKSVNATGYCIGGTLLAVTLAYMKAKKDKRISSATLMACMTDFEDAGELSVFVDDEQLAALKKSTDRKGYLSGDEMAGVFSLMRANDLIWNHVINNYLLAEDSMPFDMVYWFQDSTRLPAGMISWYLDVTYNRNLLGKPGGVELDGTSIDITSIKTPLYFLSTEEDHICPWKATYEGARRINAPMTFVLGGSGHNAGVVNPPTRTKYGYRTNAAMPDTADAWSETAEQHEGSWWPHWARWLGAKSGKQVPARQPGSGETAIIEPAPGSYVKVR